MPDRGKARHVNAPVAHRTRSQDLFVLGISGSDVSLLHPLEDWPNELLLPSSAAHDSAAVLLANGEVLFAVEEERLNRVKHANRLPAQAIRLCLQEYAARSTASSQLHVAYYNLPSSAALKEHAVDATVQALAEYFGITLPPTSVHLLGHHYCHAASAFLPSPFSESLVLSIDAEGDGLCATINVGNGSSIRVLREVPWHDRSVGFLYDEVTRHLGFARYDEYKVMGLAPYGDPARYRRSIRRAYELLPAGEWRVRLAELPAILRSELGAARRHEDPVLQHHCDIAAALQDGLETILLHILSHYRVESKQKYLCLAGGVALNCTANSRILASGLFDDVFVQPAAHDAGAALGAALAVHSEITSSRPAPMRHVYWGPRVNGDEIPRQLGSWASFVEFEHCADVFARAAELLDAGNVLGWVSGRSEFGPRALGNRSILADPRPASQKDLINAMVKKREAFRPFAPAVLEEAAAEYFVMGPGRALPWMIFVADVVPEKRQLLGAVTHIDGSARVQTVAHEINPRFWRLLSAFRERTGLPILLNTSFNNNAEPIVESIADAIVCFLTTGLNFLVLDDYLVRKKPLTPAILSELIVSLPAYMKLEETTQYASDGRLMTYRGVSNRYYLRRVFPVSPATARALQRADCRRTVAEVLDCPVEQVFEEILELWSERLIRLTPNSDAY